MYSKSQKCWHLIVFQERRPIKLQVTTQIRTKCDGCLHHTTVKEVNNLAQTKGRSNLHSLSLENCQNIKRFILLKTSSVNSSEPTIRLGKTLPWGPGPSRQRIKIIISE